MIKLQKQKKNHTSNFGRDQIISNMYHQHIFTVALDVRTKEITRRFCTIRIWYRVSLPIAQVYAVFTDCECVSKKKGCEQGCGVLKKIWYVLVIKGQKNQEIVYRTHSTSGVYLSKCCLGSPHQNFWRKGTS
jgi:hypothetical protein